MKYVGGRSKYEVWYLPLYREELTIRYNTILDTIILVSTMYLLSTYAQPKTPGGCVVAGWWADVSERQSLLSMVRSSISMLRYFLSLPMPEG